MLERVQGGIIGQTLSSFGITGLYITFVFGIGRFLRFSTQNARMRIQYEDLPTTQRLVALCQVRLLGLEPPVNQNYFLTLIHTLVRTASILR